MSRKSRIAKYSAHANRFYMRIVNEIGGVRALDRLGPMAEANHFREHRLNGALLQHDRKYRKLVARSLPRVPPVTIPDNELPF